MNKLFRNKTDGLLAFSEYKKRRYRVLHWGIFALMLILSLVCLLPVVWIFISGFKSTSELYAIPPSFLPEAVDFHKPLSVWRMFDFKKYYFNSLMLVAGCLIMCLVFNGIMGYVLSRLKPAGTTLVFTLVFWSMLLPTSMNIVPLFASFVDVPLLHVNITNTYVPIWLMAGANAFNVLLFRNFFNSIPMSYIEAARIDGCTNVGIFARIVLPMSKPIIMVVSIFTINETWSSFLWPYLIVNEARAVPIAVKLYLLKSTGITTDKYMFAILFTIIPPMIMYCLFSKQIMGGLNMSGLKG